MARPPDELDYYSPETNFFPTVAKTFSETGHIEPEAFYLILDWKSSRARTKHLYRLALAAGSFDEAVKRIAGALHKASEPERLRILMVDWSFRLPTATAILSVLYPDTYTIYDVRMCRTLGKFDRLGDGGWKEALWRDYRCFRDAVRENAPKELTLRDCDRWLWGQDKRRAMHADLANVSQNSKDD